MIENGEMYADIIEQIEKSTEKEKRLLLDQHEKNSTILKEGSYPGGGTPFD